MVGLLPSISAPALLEALTAQPNACDMLPPLLLPNNNPAHGMHVHTHSLQTLLKHHASGWHVRKTVPSTKCSHSLPCAFV